MRKFYTFILAFIASMALWAQDLPTEVNVAGELGMGDYDSSKPWTMKSDGTGDVNNHSYGDYWKGVGLTFFFDYITDGNSLYDGRPGYTAAGFYADGKVKDDNPNIYQVLKMPAGHYTIRVQAVYRDTGGEKVGEAISNFRSKGTYKKNAWAYADVLSSSDPESEVTSSFSKAIRHIGSAESEENLCTWPSDTWRQDGSFKVLTDEWDEEFEEYVEKTFYYPKSILGASMHFQKGYYWNEFDILLTEESYVKIGLKKTDYIAEDWLGFGAWEIIFHGQPSDDVKIAFAQQEYDRVKGELEALKNKFDTTTSFKMINQSFTSAIAASIDDAMLYNEEEYNSAEDLKDYMAIINDEKEMVDYFEDNYEFLGYLNFLITKAKKLEETSDLPGLATYKSELDAAIDEINSKDEFSDEDRSYEWCQAIYNKIADIRGNYLDTQEADENGAKDFSAVINHPWFVNDGYEPTWVEESSWWQILEETWADRNSLAGPGSYTDKRDGTDPARTDIASDVKIYDDNKLKNEWYEDVEFTGCHNLGISLQYQSGLIGACDTWHSNQFTSGYERLCQNVIGLPSGYYSLKALLRGHEAWNGEYHNIFATNSAGETVKSPVGLPDDEYAVSAEYGWNEWQPSAWVEHKTGIIHVPDGQLLIGGESQMCANYTGFRLLFYGEEPPVNNLIQEDIAEVQKNAEVLQFAGDKAYVAEQLAKCVLPVEGTKMFDTYRGYINDANAYINTAVMEQKKYKAVDTYNSIVADNPETESMISPALLAALDLGTNVKDTYKDIAPANELANKYKEYAAAYVDAQKYDDADLKSTLASQKAAIDASIQTTAQLTSYISALARPIKVAALAAAGAARATEQNPVDVTSLIVNPTFEAGNVTTWDPGTTTGWTASGVSTQTNEYSRGNVEIWDQAVGKFSQKLIGMPAGKYVLTCYALYRDATAVTTDLVKAYKEAGNEENWANHNAELFVKTSMGNDFASYVKAIEALNNIKAPSFDRVATAYEWDEENNNEPYATAMTTSAPEGEGEDIVSVQTWTHTPITDYPFDTQLDVDGTTYYYPASMFGFYQCFLQYPEVFRNSVEFEVQEDETVEIGLRKNVEIDQDWLIFDDFKLYYTSGDVFANRATSIVDVKAKQTKGATYNLAGQKVDDSYRGIVIKNGRKTLQK